jgi:hypothetical protein
MFKEFLLVGHGENSFVLSRTEHGYSNVRMYALSCHHPPSPDQISEYQQWLKNAGWGDEPCPQEEPEEPEEEESDTDPGEEETVTKVSDKMGPGIGEEMEMERDEANTDTDKEIDTEQETDT